jgi:CRISPR/Cas system-associated exonuclease Cas4 (RecB family)
MKTFLEYVAEDVLAKHGTNLSRTAVVFPNKRASLFFNELLAKKAQKPIWSPAYITISELFRAHSNWQTGDQIKLICDLHKCFIETTGIEETLDHFYGWGQLLLADFDDIDKNMADAEKVFANVRDIHEFDDVSYLTKEQKSIIKKFFSNFTENHNTELKQRFLRLWSHFFDIYKHYNECLQKQGLAYEGALYRHVVCDETIQFEYNRYIFVGFNLLQKVEQRLFQRLQQQGKALFYWDFDQYYMAENEAGYYIRQYLDKFPNELPNDSDEIYQNFKKPKHITYVTATTENIQARYIAQWLQEEGRIEAGKRTAIVLCDESLLPMTIHCLPDNVEKANITTGYPLALSPVSSMLMQLYALQTNGWDSSSARFRLQYINKVLRHPYAQFISPRYKELFRNLNEQHIYYAKPAQLSLDEAFEQLFTPITDRQQPAFTMSLCQWMMQQLRNIASNSRQSNEACLDPFYEESLFRAYTLLNRLYGLMDSGSLTIDATTLYRLIMQLIQGTSVPFHGEPAIGLQLMGVLETRNLDFDHVLLLSCNEGNMPKGVNDTSFIPYSIRKAFDLTTIDHKVAIYSYYFHRLLQRATDVTLVYNNATEDGKTGEMSRFMLQMLVESGHSIERQTLHVGQSRTLPQPQAKDKTPEVIERLRRHFDYSMVTEEQRNRPLLTPSAINLYMNCPLKFYYRYVCGLKELDEQDEDKIDGRIFGNIFHEAAHRIYEQLGFQLEADPIHALLKNKIEIERAVDNAIRKELFKLKGNNKMPDLNGLQIINREVIIRYLSQLLKVDEQLAPFSILGLETPVMCKWQIELPGSASFLTTLGGTIDRLDCITDNGEEIIRVVDYKTGRNKLENMSDVSAIFEQEKIEKHSNYYLQTFLYSMIVSSQHESKVIPALFFVQNSSQEDYNPTLKLGKETINDISVYKVEFEERLRPIINEMFNPDIPFRPTETISRCATCPFKELCTS